MAYIYSTIMHILYNTKNTKSPKLLLLLEWKYIFDIVAAVILGAFSSSNEDIKTAASYALGAVAVGNLTKYLPFVLKEIDSQTKRQYLLLHSLKVLTVRQIVVSLFCFWGIIHVT